jgi:hypothetical protein
MKLLPTYGWRFLVLPFLVAMAMAQGTPSPAPAASAPGSGPAVPYASVSQLNLILSQLEQVAQATQVDLAKLRIEKWKTDSNTKRSTSADVDSLQRNLQNALPEIIAQLRASPENVGATFKLYRNLDALFDVLGPVVESAGAFGSKDEFQSVQNDLSAIERSRRELAERMETTQVRDLQAAAAPPPVAPKKVVVDDTEPPKKVVKKKTVPKPPKPSPSTTTPTSSTTTTSQPATQQPQTQPHP